MIVLTISIFFDSNAAGTSHSSIKNLRGSERKAFWNYNNLEQVKEMMPGMNPRKMQQIMKQMGMKQKEIPAMRVIIETQDGNLVFENPSVTETQVQGQSTFQIMGKYAVVKQETEIDIPDEDVELVSSQAGVTKEAARKALEIAKGDLAQAIMDLQG